MNAKENTQILAEYVSQKLNLPVFGVATLGPIFSKVDKQIEAVARKMKYAVVLGHPLSKGVLDTIVNRPTILYKHHYKQVNWRLDRSALELAIFMESLGAKALPIPASIILNWKKQTAHFSHRDAALQAGLGWRGRHGLVVTPHYGAQIRWASILTDLELIPGEPMHCDCGDCRACLEVCPAGAISEDGCDVELCFEKLKKFAGMRGIGQYICGVCIKACRGKENG